MYNIMGLALAHQKGVQAVLMLLVIPVLKTSQNVCLEKCIHPHMLTHPSIL